MPDMPDMPDMDMGGMAMTFSSLTDYKVKILWDFWNVTTRWQYALSCLTIVALCVLYHYIRSVEMRYTQELVAGRAAQVQAQQQDLSALMDEGSGVLAAPLLRAAKAGAPPRLRRLRLRLVAAGTAGYALALLLMLVAMTFNSGLFVALLAGWAAGQWLCFDAGVAAAGAARVEHCH
ncbi:Ctr copper transporter [Tribonema minus]|uniref:Copper transport protein n=1 Tax=Tribonema minus TaxID=303371 RepID=A0A835YT31_9STRA|nr:Ctr copper transporter [Tribonema minus]